MNERSTRRLAGVMVALGLAAPALGGDVAPPEAPPLTLQRVMELAVGQSPEVLAASSGQTEADAARRLAAATLRPELSFSTGPGYAGGVPGPMVTTTKKWSSPSAPTPSHGISLNAAPWACSPRMTWRWPRSPKKSSHPVPITILKTRFSTAR